MWPTGSTGMRVTLVAGLLLFTLHLFPQESVLDRQLKLPGISIKASRALGEVSKLTGYLFTYDSRIINPDRIFAVPPAEMKLAGYTRLRGG